MSWHPARQPIRLRLALVYTVVLVVACTALLALNYALLYQRLYTRVGAPTSAELAQAAEHPPTDALGVGKLQSLQAERAQIVSLRNEALLKTAETSALALVVIAVIGFAVCWVVAGRLLRPLHKLTAATQRISQDRLDERLNMVGPPDELKELAGTFDAMLSRLEASFISQRRFVADASHELRTPMAIIRTGAEVLLAKRQSTIVQWEAMGQRTLIAARRAERLLDGLLALARSDSGVIVTEPHDLAIAAAFALSDADGEAEQAALTITTDLRPAPVEGDRVLLDRMVSNLVDNAVRYSHPDGWVHVATGHGDGKAVVTVRNSGDVIPPSEVDRLFEPFQRLASHRAAGSSSSGLGLAIVRSIVHAHGGAVTAVPNPEGGLNVTTTFPAVVPMLAAEHDTSGSLRI